MSRSISIVNKIIEVLGLSESSIEYVEDRKGHDPKYAIDSDKLRNLGWKPEKEFEEALAETIQWYADNRDWWQYFVETYNKLGLTNKL